MIHHVYMNWWVPPIIAKFFLMAEAIMVSSGWIYYYKNKKTKSKAHIPQETEPGIFHVVALGVDVGVTQILAFALGVTQILACLDTNIVALGV